MASKYFNKNMNYCYSHIFAKKIVFRVYMKDICQFCYAWDTFGKISLFNHMYIFFIQAIYTYDICQLYGHFIAV